MLRRNLFFILWSLTSVCLASTYYIALDGNDLSSGTGQTPWATFQHAYETMAGGDTLLIKNGYYDQTYHASDRTFEEEIFCSWGLGIPSGTSNAYTVIKAETDWGVTVTNDLTITPGSYIQIQGIHFNNGGYMSGSDHIKVIRCSFKGTVCNDNTTVICAGTGCSYILFEECFIYGCGRYKLMAYGDQDVATEKIIFRRCVSRHDYHYPGDNWGQQCATFTSYDCHDLLMQNCIAINSGEDDPYLYGNLYGGIWFENKQTTGEDNSAVIQGCIFLDLGGLAAINDPNNNGNRVIENCVIWDSKGGYGGGVRSGSPTLSIDHLTVGDIWGEFQDQSYAWGAGVYTGEGFASQHLRNSLLTNCNSYGIADYVNSDYNNYYGNTENFGNNWQVPTPVAGTNDEFIDPGLKYICRIEDSSLLEGAASDGGDIGATILNRYGVSGTLWGDPGYNTLTSESLWPFPNERVIKETMRNWDGENDPKRGFCTDGNGLYQGPITLTSYIWEYLGNACPEEICTASSIPAERPEYENIEFINFPNPFYESTLLQYYLTQPGNVNIEIRNILGSLYDIIDIPGQIAGIHEYSLSMEGYASGIYYLALNSGNQRNIRKIEFIRQ